MGEYFSGSGIGDLFKKYLEEYFNAHSDMLPASGLYERILNEIEPHILTAALEYTGGNRLQAAHILGINRNTLRKKMQQHNISVYIDEKT